ncbi:hypothetical protein ABPG72_016649 [Tetrahymena utriculariae]
MDNLKQINIGGNALHIYKLRNEIHFIGNQKGQVEELFYLRFNNPIHGVEILNFSKSKEKIMFQNQVLYNTLLMVLDEELCWKILGFQKKNNNEQIKSQEIVTLMEYNSNQEYTNRIDQIKIKGVNYLSCAIIDSSSFFCLISNEINQENVFALTICLNQKGINTTFSILNMSSKYPTAYEKRNIFSHKIISDSILGDSENVLQQKNEFIQVFVEQGIDLQQRSIISFLIDKNTHEIIQGNIIIENINEKLLNFYILAQTKLVLIYDESIKYYDSISNKIEVLVQGLKIKGTNQINENLIYILDHECMSELKVESNGSVKKSELCRIGTQLSDQYFKEGALLNNNGYFLGRQQDESLAVCELIQKKIVSLKQIYVNYFFSVEYVKVIQELQYNYIYTSKRVTEYTYQLEKHYHCDQAIKNSAVFSISNKLDRLFLTNQISTTCVDYNNQIYMITDECLQTSYFYQLAIKNDKNLLLDSNPEVPEYQFIDKSSYSIYFDCKQIEYKTNKLALVTIQITQNQIVIKIKDDVQEQVVEAKLSALFTEDILFDNGFLIKDSIFLQIGDQIHILIVNFEMILSGEKDPKKFITNHLIHRLENDEEIEQIFNLNSYQIIGLKQFSVNKIEIYQLNKEKKPYLKKIQEFGLDSLDTITQIQEYSLKLNNTNYILKEISFYSKTQKLHFLTNDDLLQNKMNPEKVRSEINYQEIDKMLGFARNSNDRSKVNFQNVWKGGDKIYWVYQNNYIIYLLSININQIIDSQNLLENIKFEYRKLEIEDVSDSFRFVIVNTFMINTSILLNILQSNKDNSIKIQPIKIIPSTLSKTNFTCKTKRFNQKPLDFQFIDDIYSPLSIIILSQSEEGLYFINLVSKQFEIVQVFQINGFTQISGLFYSIYCGVVGCFYGCEKYNLNQNTEAISSFKETNILAINYEKFLELDQKVVSKQEQWMNNFQKDQQKYFQKVIKYTSKSNPKETYANHLNIRDEIILQIQSLKETPLFIILVQDKIVLAHLSQIEGKQIDLTFIYSFEWENSLYHVFKNEIPPQEIDMLEFMKDFKDNMQFKEMIVINYQCLLSSSNLVVKAQLIALTDDNQLNWLQLDTSIPTIIQSLASTKIDQQVDKLICFNQENKLILIQLNKSDIHQCQLIQEERTGRDYFEIKLINEVYTKNEEILDVALLNNYSAKHKIFTLKQASQQFQTNNQNIVILKRGGLMEIYSSNNWNEQQFQGYL